MISRVPRSKRLLSALAGAFAITLGAFSLPSLAGDPFRANSPRPIGEKTQQAFNAIFLEGNYREAAEGLLQQAEAIEPNEPLVHAMQASIAYTDWQANKKDTALLETVKSYAIKTGETAERLKTTDAVRGNLYTAVSHGLEAATILEEEGSVRGAAKALGKLQQVYGFLDAAEKEAPQDPELNLIKGWMDLLIAVNLPFSDPTGAIARLEVASPSYLANRGIAVGYRDLKNYDEALKHVDRALEAAPNNPELHYLKAQILVRQAEKNKLPDQRHAAKADFAAALTKSNQLPKGLVAQIFFEHCRNQRRIDDRDRNCDVMRDQIRDNAGRWGPAASLLPALD
ncbi:Sll0314/Alr1548 family TPR repeat-containing protein [Microseira wollei]|uniref:Tetratricopeptide TPR_2 n=1 Tax=Microseira wollei NIES-4236 TaxID=2530354 RepID=A0AAV3XPL9_9CYAN|nr:Sll0314/Alr1548 family TPR repeat-containing protein [Microseira wollei]GET42644.1 tetratricopeptide TPR_2 [Microseira wollei NIES-4236]